MSRVVRSALLVASLVVTSAACNALIALDAYRNCQSAECSGSDAAPAADSGPTCECAPDNHPRCSSEAGSTDLPRCEGATPVCSLGACTSVTMLAQGSSDHSCVLLQDGTLRCWGSNDTGQCGNGSSAAIKVAAAVVGLTNVVDVGVGDHSTCALTGDGAVYCWGTNAAGQLGKGSIGGSSTTPLQVALAGKATAISVGEYSECASLDSGVVCWGQNDQGQAGASPGTPVLTPTAVPGIPFDVGQLSVGGYAVCVTHASGASIWCRGNDQLGILGDGKTTSAPGNHFDLPMATYYAPLNLPGVQYIAQGEVQICAWTGDSGWCWGGNYYGLAIGDLGAAAPVVPTPAPVQKFQKLTTGWRDTCALMKDSTVTCWGQNDHGQMGNGVISPSTNSAMGPTKVALTDVVDIAFHRGFGCALKRDSSVWCWGGNGPSAVLGDGTSYDQPSPVQVKW